MQGFSCFPSGYFRIVFDFICRKKSCSLWCCWQCSCKYIRSDPVDRFKPIPVLARYGSSVLLQVNSSTPCDLFILFKVFAYSYSLVFTFDSAIHLDIWQVHIASLFLDDILTFSVVWVLEVGIGKLSQMEEFSNLVFLFSDRTPEEVLAARGVKPTLSPNLNTLALVEVIYFYLACAILQFSLDWCLCVLAIFWLCWFDRWKYSLDRACLECSPEPI